MLSQKRNGLVLARITEHGIVQLAVLGREDDRAGELEQCLPVPAARNGALRVHGHNLLQGGTQQILAVLCAEWIRAQLSPISASRKNQVLHRVPDITVVHRHAGIIIDGRLEQILFTLLIPRLCRSAHRLRCLHAHKLRIILQHGNDFRQMTQHNVGPAGGQRLAGAIPHARFIVLQQRQHLRHDILFTGLITFRQFSTDTTAHLRIEMIQQSDQLIGAAQVPWRANLFQ